MGRGTNTEEPVESVAIGRRFQQRRIYDRAAPIRLEIDPRSLDRFRGCFTFGVSDAMFDRVLSRLSRRLGVRLVAVWDDFDDDGFYGEAEVMVIDELQQLRELPDELYGWFYSMDAPPPPAEIEVKPPEERFATMRYTGQRHNGVDLIAWGLKNMTGTGGIDDAFVWDED